MVSVWTVLIGLSMAPVAPAHAQAPSEFEDLADAYDEVIRISNDLRAKNGIKDGEETPQYIVDQVVRDRQSRQELRDSGDAYGTKLGYREIAACATNPADCARAKSAIKDAERISVERFPGDSNDNAQDADRHCIWQALTTIRSNADFARQIGDAHEADHPGSDAAAQMDQANNQTGREVGQRHPQDEGAAINECHDLAASGQLVTLK
nr:hypothetical protein [Corynebacterium liangguodongii]